jgi:hypothetical protein
MTDAERFCRELQTLTDFAQWPEGQRREWSARILRRYQIHVQPMALGQRLIFPDYSVVENLWKSPNKWHALPISEVWRREYRQ